MSKEPVIAREGNTLRQEMGKDFRISKYITEERIRSCEVLIEKAGDAFFDDAAPELAALEELASLTHGESFNSEAIITRTYTIRSLAQVLGFTLITELCVYLVNVVEDKQLSDKKRKLLVNKLAEALRLAFDRRIRDDGGAIGKALLESLRAHF